MSITPEICPHCGQAIGNEETLVDLWKRILSLRSALLRCHSSLNIFEVKNICDKALKGGE